MAHNLPFMSLNAASSTGAGTSRDLEGTLAYHTMFVGVTGDPSTWYVKLEGSHDGSVWFELAHSSNMQPLSVVNVTDAVRFVRANLDTLSGGTSPTVTATIGSA